MDVSAPPVDDPALDGLTEPDDDDQAPLDDDPVDEGDIGVDDAPPVTTGRRRRRSGRRRTRLLNRLTLPSGTLELGVFAVVVFVVWWTTRSWVVAGLVVVAWTGLVGGARALHRARAATVDQRRVTRERLTALAWVVFLVFGALAGIRAWSTHHPRPTRPDPPAPYLAVDGAINSAWQTMYGRAATVRLTTQTAAGYWVVIVEDSEGCWSQSVVLRQPPVLAGERSPVGCPQPTWSPTLHGDRVDPAKSQPAQAAVDFVKAWLTEGNWGIYTQPGSTIRPLGRTVDVTDLAVYPISAADTKAVVWVTGQAADGPIGLQVGLVDDHGRWFISGVAGSPPVDVSNTRPLPATSTTSTTVEPSTTTTKR